MERGEECEDPALRERWIGALRGSEQTLGENLPRNWNIRRRDGQKTAPRFRQLAAQAKDDDVRVQQSQHVEFPPNRAGDRLRNDWPSGW